MHKFYLALILVGAFVIVIGVLFSGILDANLDAKQTHDLAGANQTTTNLTTKQTTISNYSASEGDTQKNEIEITHNNETIFKTFTKGEHVYIKIGMTGKSIELSVKD